MDNYLKFVKNFRKNIPERYNQIELVDSLFIKKIDFYISISNRTDGKSFNYLNFFINLSKEYNFKFLLVCRHYTLRQAYCTFLAKIYSTDKSLKATNLVLKRTDHYVIVLDKEKVIGVITDLNSASDLKYHSNFLQDFPIIVYDEFLALEGDYLPDEWDKLKTVFESVDRADDTEHLPYPKVFLLGNAVNFSSPLLANLDIFNILERHPINSMAEYGNILLEMRRNDNANEKRNKTAFATKDDPMKMTKFKFNKYNLITEDEKKAISKNNDFFYIKMDNIYLRVDYNRDTLQSNLKIEPYAEEYYYCKNIADLNESVIFLNDSYYNMNHSKKHEKGFYRYDNAYTKTVMTTDNNMLINILKCIKRHRKVDIKPDIEKIVVDNEISRIKKNLYNKFMGV